MNNYYNIFPNNTVTLGSYDPFSQFINLNSLTFDEFKNIRTGLDSEEKINGLSLFRHELAHWIDHISTLWGNQNLFLLFNAINARATNSINDFWRIKMYADSVMAERYFDYFTQIYNPINGSKEKRWQATQSAGFKFQANGYVNTDRPILFTRFRTNEGIDVARVPITIASILEVIATKEEYKTKFMITSSLQDVVTKKLLEKKYSEELFNLIYNSNLTLYNVIAHLTANLSLQDDIIWTLETASKIGTVVLNLPQLDVQKISRFVTGQKGIDDRSAKFIESGDKGFIFYNLLQNLIKEKGIRNYSTEDLLSSSGLEDIESIEQKVVVEMKANVDDLLAGPFKPMAEKLMLEGIEVFKARGIDGRKNIKFEELTTKPKLMFGDTSFDDTGFTVNEVLEKLNKKEEINFHESYYLFEHFKDKLDEFIKVCGI